jgi:hypothetical protein
LWGAVAAFVLCAAASLVLAQSIVDPRIVEFNPSPDHARTVNGQAAVTRYDLEFYLLNGQTPLVTVSLGKPSPDPDGVIRVNFESLLASVPAAGVLYVARVVAVGPGGESRSTPSNQFSFEGAACTVSVNPASLSLTGGASTGTILVTAPAGCGWSASEGASWVTITSGANGSGNGSVGYSVSANNSTAQRSTSITIGGQTIALTQGGATCSYTLSQGNATAPPGGLSGTVTVTSLTGCAWTAASNAAWITVTNGASGQGSGSVAYSVAAYNGTTARTGTITIAGRAFTVTQNGVSCTPSITPATATAPPGGTTNGSVSVSAASSCGWTAAANNSWITVTNGASGQGAGTVRYSVAAHSGTSSRTGTITIAGLTYRITQSGITCTYSVSPSTQSVAFAGGTMTATVTAPAGCTWNASEGVSWISISSGASGTGNGTVRYAVSAHTGSASRSATLTVAGRSVAVTQAANTCTFTVTPAAQSVGRAGGVMTASVTAPAGCTWQATESSSWVSIASGASGRGNGTVRYNVSAYSGTSSRSATVTIAGRPVRVTQSAASPPTTPAGLRIVGSR